MQASRYGAWFTVGIGLLCGACSAKVEGSAEARASAGSSGAEASASASGSAYYQAGNEPEVAPQVAVDEGPAPSLNPGPAAVPGWNTPQGGYGGVVPGKLENPDHLPAAPGTAAMVTWHGFQDVPGQGSRVFVQTSKRVEATVRRAKSGYEVVMAGVEVPEGNSRLPLETGFFNTPVRRARIVKQGSEAIVKLDMRADVKPKVRQEKSETGYWFTYLEFPAGSFD